MMLGIMAYQELEPWRQLSVLFQSQYLGSYLAIFAATSTTPVVPPAEHIAEVHLGCTLDHLLGLLTDPSEETFTVTASLKSVHPQSASFHRPRVHYYFFNRFSLFCMYKFNVSSVSAIATVRSLHETLTL